MRRYTICKRCDCDGECEMEAFEKRLRQEERGKCAQQIDIVFDGPPGPESGRFIEVEDASGRSIRFGEWLQRTDGFWVLRIARTDLPQPSNS